MIELRPAESSGYRAYWSNGVLVGEVYREVDGYFVWWPQDRGGCMSADFLRCMADKLDELNKEWDEQIRHDLCGPSSGPVTGKNYIPSTDTGVPWDEEQA